MKNNLLAEPDLEFIKIITSSGGRSVKNCYQCATCSVACTMSHGDHPFPRKEMLFASWGLKDKLMANPDIWLCYNCQDCSARCPRGARPGDVLGAIRRASIGHYSKPAWFNKFLNDPKLIPLLFLIPAMVIALIGSLTGLINFNPATETIIFADFFPVSLIEILFIPLSFFSTIVFFSGLKRFIHDMQKHYEHQGIVLPGKRIDLTQYLVAFVPYSKLAHFVYRTTAITFDSYVRSQGRSVLKTIPISG